MPYSKSKNLLFVHIPKNAGKSIEVFFGITSEQEVNRYKFRSLPNRFATFLQRASSDSKALPRLWGIGDYTLCYQHLTLLEIELLQLLPKVDFESANKLAVVRNPWSRAVSTYRHFWGEDASLDRFEEFVSTWYDLPSKNHNELSHRRPQTDFVMDREGKFGVEILRFETLGADLDRFCLSSGIKVASELPHIGGDKNELQNYRRYYTKRSQSMIADRFSCDVEQFSYEF
jgi:hypothetical protein